MMNKLKEIFRKNGLDYQLIMRNDKVALFELLFDGECVGWEVSRIYFQKEIILSDRHFQESEVLPGNEKFGMEGSKAFHMDGRDKAEIYFDILTNGLKMSNSLESIRLEARSAFRRGITPLRGYIADDINMQ